MIIFKPKSFVTDIKDSKLISTNPKRYTPVCFNLWNSVDMTIGYSKTYEEDMKKLGPVTKKRIKDLVNDIKKGYIYTDGPKNTDADTHMIYEKSSNTVLTYNKAVNSNTDRLTYNIRVKDGKLIIKILSCLGHKFDKEKSYSK